MIKNILLVGLGSFAGGILRYIVGVIINNKQALDFPLGTFLVNITGCFLAGLLMGFLDKSATFSYEWKLLLLIGFCGGFTTFSAFAIENMALLKNGHFLMFFSYTFFSIAIGLVFVYIGFLISSPVAK